MVKNTNMFTEADIAVDTDIIDTGDSVSSFITGTEALEKLNSIEVGIPVVIKWGSAEDAPTRQALFAGKGEGSYGNIIYNFFDNSGISGIASTSEGFIKDGNVSFDFENNDATEVGILTDKLKQQSGTNESEELNEIGPLAAGLLGVAGGAIVGNLATSALSKDESEEPTNEAEEAEYVDPTPEMKIKDWYTSIAPEDYQLDKINAETTFADLKASYDKDNKLNLSQIGDIDSDPRNEIVTAMADLYDLPTNDIDIIDDYKYEAEETDSKESSVESRLLDLAHVSSNKYTLDDLQLYVTDKGNFNIRTKADDSNPIGKDIITVSYDSLIKDEDDEIELRELGYFNDYSNMLLSDEPLTEGVIPASNFDFAHEELSVIQAEIEKIAGLKSEDTSNELYTDLLEVLDKAVGVLTDYIAEQPIGTVVGDSEPISDEPVEDSWADEMGEGVPVDEEPEDDFEESEKVEGNTLVEDNLMEGKKFPNTYIAEIGFSGVVGACRGIGNTPEEAKENAFKLCKQVYPDVIEDLMQKEDYQGKDELEAVEDWYGISVFDMSSGASNEGGSSLKD